MAAENGDSSKAGEPTKAKGDEAYSVKECLTDLPPGENHLISNPAIKRVHNGPVEMHWPTLRLHCSSDTCKSLLTCDPDPSSTSFYGTTKAEHVFLHYVCRQCRNSIKTYAVFFLITSLNSAQMLKVGETPSFGRPLPDRLLRMAGGKERDNFFKGRQCENQGLGIGAFIYYRRIVEHLKDRLIDEIKKVAVSLDADAEMIAGLDAARKETKFTAAMERIKDGIPESLKIKGSNPLRLLHTALSEGVHEKTDKECLALATQVRVVLTDLVEKLGAALNDSVELNDAVSRLLELERQRRSAQQPPNP